MTDTQYNDLRILILSTFKDVLTEKEAAECIGKSIGTLRNMVSKGKIAVHKPGGRKGPADSYFLKSDLYEYMTRNRVPSDKDLNMKASTYNNFKIKQA